MTDLREEVRIHLERARRLVLDPLLRVMYQTAFSEYDLMIRLALLEELTNYLKAAIIVDRKRVEVYAVIRAVVTVDVEHIDVPRPIYPPPPPPDPPVDVEPPRSPEDIKTSKTPKPPKE